MMCICQIWLIHHQVFYKVFVKNDIHLDLSTNNEVCILTEYCQHVEYFTLPHSDTYLTDFILVNCICGDGTAFNFSFANQTSVGEMLDTTKGS